MSPSVLSPYGRKLLRSVTPSLRGRLVLLVLFALLPAAGFLLFMSLNERQHLRDDAYQHAQRLVQLAALEQKQLLVGANQQLLTLSQLPIVRDTSRIADCNRTFANLHQLYTYYANLGVADLRGNLWCSGLPPKKPVNVADRDYFREVLAEKNFAVSDYQIGRITRKGSFTVAYPVLNDNGVVRAVVFIALDIERWLEGLYKKLTLPAGTILLIVNDRATVLARYPDRENLRGKTLPDAPLIQAVFAQDGGDNLEETGLDGVNRLHVFAPVPFAAGNQAYMVAGVPTETIYGDANRKFFQGLALLLLIAGLVLGAGWYGSQVLILHPTARLIAAVRNVGKGDLTTRSGLSHVPGELGELSRHIDDMAENLERHDREIHRTQHALHTLSAGNRALIKAADEATLLQDMCEVAVKTGGYRMAWIGYVEHDEAKSIRPVAHAGFEAGHLATLRLSWADNERGRGPGGTAVRTGEPCLIRHIDTDPRFAPWREEALARGYRSIICLPLKIRSAVMGIFCLLAAEPDAFTDDEIDLLREMADDLAFGIESLRTRAAHEQARNAIHRMSHYDVLTGLPNAQMFSEALVEALLDAEQQKEPLALLEIDVERLREINDALGFSQGDELLRQFGDRLKVALGEDTLIARLRGDEFAALLPRTTADAAEEITRRAIAILNAPYLVAEIPLDVPSHIGIVIFPEHGSTPHDLLRRVDMAMHQAKKKGLGHLLFDPHTVSNRPRRLAMAGELRRAIENGDMLLYLQPKVELASGRPTGAEGLVRWKHAERGLIPPSEFIDLAEHTGLIKPLTEWVIETALRQGHDLQRRGTETPIAVNLSARNLREPELVNRIRHLRATWNTVPLELEITESAIMEDAEHALEVLRQLDGDGIPLHIDDFGTGYSSLSYLQKLPVSAIKIDRSFVADMTTDNDSALIVRSTIDLAHDLGLKVIAEGVENIAAWKYLASLGCDIVQGYFIGKPMPLEEFPAWRQAFRLPAPNG